MHLLGGLGAQMGPSIDFRTIFGCPRGGFGRPWGPFGLSWGTEWRPERPKNRKNTELCNRYVAKAGRVRKTGSPNPPNVVKTWQIVCFSYIQHSGTLASKSVAQAPQKWTSGVTLGTRGRLEEPCVRTGRHRSRFDAARRLQAEKVSRNPSQKGNSAARAQRGTAWVLSTLTTLGEGFV